MSKNKPNPPNTPKPPVDPKPQPEHKPQPERQTERTAPEHVKVHNDPQKY